MARYNNPGRGIFSISAHELRFIILIILSTKNNSTQLHLHSDRFPSHVLHLQCQALITKCLSYFLFIIILILYTAIINTKSFGEGISCSSGTSTGIFQPFAILSQHCLCMSLDEQFATCRHARQLNIDGSFHKAQIKLFIII